MIFPLGATSQLSDAGLVPVADNMVCRPTNLSSIFFVWAKATHSRPFLLLLSIFDSSLPLMDQNWIYSSQDDLDDSAWVDFSDHGRTSTRIPEVATSSRKVVVDVDDDVELPSNDDCEKTMLDNTSLNLPEPSFSSFRQSWENSISPTLEAASALRNTEQSETGSQRRKRTAKGVDCDSDIPEDQHANEGERNAPASFPNEPHPMLECPLLYHALRCCSPSLLQSSKLLYIFRWRLSYTLQHRVPFQYGIQATWGELLLLLPFGVYVAYLLLVFATFDTNVILATGRLARIGLIAALVFAQRSHSIVTILLGLPIHRAQKYHRLAGMAAGLAGVLHTLAILQDPVVQFQYHGSVWRRAWFADWMHGSGTIALSCLVGLVLSSLPLVRKYCFEAFYYLHRVFLVGLLVSAWFHGGPVLPLVACGTWGLDRLLCQLQRWWLHPRQAHLRTIGSSVVEVRFPKTKDFCYNPGQFVYLTVPAISSWQSHPISISSAPCQGNVVTLHVRVCGDWTAALYQLAASKRAKWSVDVLVEGPYGNLSVDLMGGDRKYKKVLLVSGGIGVAPLQSISDQLLYEYSHGQRELHRLQFIWMERDPVVVENARKQRGDETEDGVPHNNLAELLLAMFPPPSSDNGDEDDESSSSVPTIMPPGQLNRVILEHPDETGAPPCQVDVNVYLTSKQQHDTSSLPPFACRGRPDWTELFFATRKEALREQQSKIAVCVSGPLKLQLQLHKACIFFSDERVRFDFHAEQRM